jgi:hypothetical protein
MLQLVSEVFIRVHDVIIGLRFVWQDCVASTRSTVLLR